MPISSSFAPGKARPFADKAFTLLEILVVIALLSLLMAMLFPVFAQVRGKTRDTACVSNLRQIGQALALYSQDYDGVCPNGADPIVKYADKMRLDPALRARVKDLPMLHEVLQPYVKEKRIWMCPSDFGFDQLDQIPGSDAKPLKLNARPSAYEAFGSSYGYRIEMTFGQVIYGGNGHFQGREIGPANIIYLHDLCGVWHGSDRDFMREYRFCDLYADGHAKSNNFSQDWDGWGRVESLDEHVPDPPDPE